jgi:hypothetical protein
MRGYQAQIWQLQDNLVMPLNPACETVTLGIYLIPFLQ